MTVQEKSFVEIEYTLTLDSGEVVDRSAPDKPLGFIFGVNAIIPGLEKKLTGMSAGESAKLVVEADEAYGKRDEELVRELPRGNFPEGMDIEVGMIFQAQSPQGPANLRVVEVGEETIKGDFNHPLAGERLNFDVKIVNVREASDAELASMTSCDPAGGCGTGCCGC